MPQDRDPAPAAAAAAAAQPNHFANAPPAQDFEQDPRWTAVDDYTAAHLSPPTRAYAAPTARALAASAAAGLPPISAHPALAKMLALHARSTGAARALEVGTLGGYTACWLALVNPAMRVTTVEVDEGRAAVARGNFARAGVEGRVELCVGRGVDVLRALVGEVERGKREGFQFVFIDADKLNNWTYFDLAVRMSVPGGVVYVDNVVLSGGIVSEEEEKRETVKVKGARDVIERVGKDERVEAVVMQNVAQKSYDGYLMAVVL